MKVTKQFIKRLKQCDKKAFSELYNEYAGLIKAIAFRYIRDWDNAEDILQETFVTIYRKIHQYAGKGSFEGWIKRIAVNNCLRFINEKQKRYFDDIDSFQIAENKDIEQVDIDDAKSLVSNTDFSQKEILDVVSELPDGFRIVFSMYVLEEYKHKEIAELLEISESTSKTQLLRARKLIQKKLFAIALKKHSITENIFFKEVIGKRGDNNE
ncbi:MAG: sigma-70 family RNA polymerase sigma factor [Bacteroidales bacterium]|nr:sigma-70 family RNA polymerase sigma factor [Bacteroidales bacterium]